MRGGGKFCMREPPRSQQGPDGLCHVQEARVSGVGWRAGARSPVGAAHGVLSRRCCQCGPGVVRPGALAVLLLAWLLSVARFRPPVLSPTGNLLWRERLCGLFLFAAVCGLRLQADDIKPF